MELKDFIKSTLVEIAEGIKDAQEEYKEIGGVVNPRGLCDQFNKNLYSFISPDIKNRNFKLSSVEFEISLTANNETEDKGGVGVLFGTFGIGANTKELGGTSSMNKIKFSVPVLFPSQYPGEH